MNQGITGKKFEQLFEEKANIKRIKAKVVNLLKSTFENSSSENVGSVTNVELKNGTDLMLENLACFHRLKDVPENLKQYFKDGTCDLGE
ncbi:MAG TPA: hypothetical protein VEP90_27735 [Methylomirabilota bacterium]|nr:hypothetical protein [Methylomirabilota bacterium]